MNTRGIALIIGVLCVGVGAAMAEVPAAPAKTKPEATQPPQASQPSEKEKLRQETRAKLKGTTWNLELKPLGGTGKSQKDTLTFTEREVTSTHLTKAGYGTSNYSVNVGDDLSVVWETMQTKEGEGPAFWRGELLPGDVMRGVLNQQHTDGQSTDFSFSGAQTGKAEPPAQAEPAATGPAPAVQDVATPGATPPAAPSGQEQGKNKQKHH